MRYPTHTFKSSFICNPWFEKNGVDAVVVPMGIKAEDYRDFFRSVFTLTNIRGALTTMPHKVTTMELVDEISRTAQIAGATNAVLRREDGSLLADQFDGAGFVCGVLRKGFDPSHILLPGASLVAVVQDQLGPDVLEGKQHFGSSGRSVCNRLHPGWCFRL
jgi:shikimate 5-dehydrogenase